MKKYIETVVALVLIAFAAVCCIRKSPIVSGTVIPLYESVAPGSEGWTHSEGVQTNPGGFRTLFNVANPTLEVFVPEHPCGSGMLVVPGGAFMILSYDSEGTEVAKRLNDQGITAFVLKYRTAPLRNASGEVATDFAEAMEIMGGLLKGMMVGSNPESESSIYDFEGARYAFADARQAMSYLHAHAAEYGLGKIGMMGFSAGAITTLHQATTHDQDSRPDFAGIIYGGWEEDSFSVPEDAMPMFMCSVVNDVFFTPEQSLRVYEAWRGAGFSVEYHTYYKADHGFGAVPTGHSSDAWMDTMFAFMKDVEFMDKSN